MSSFFSEAWKLSQTALSKQSPLDPVEGVIPACSQRPVKRTAVYCPVSTGPRNSVLLSVDESVRIILLYL